MQLSQTLIDDIISRADIVDVISKTLKLKRSGNNYFACCPFHKEKSPSFSVNSTKQFFHCFGCGESGDVISFVMKNNGLDFIDAVKNLADSYGVYIPESNVKLSKQEVITQKQLKLSLQDTIKKVVQFYRNNLVNNELAKQYLLKRGLSSAIMEEFIVGFAPNDYNALAKIFPDYLKNSFLIDSGLTLKNEKGNIYDRFRERIIFPIRNTKGEVIAFGGRVITKNEPKYLNSPETSLFNKSQELYGLFEAQKTIRDKNYVIVVEGYLDVIALAQFGIKNVVATMGTAITEAHIKKLFRLCNDIYYAFDGDNAGRKAAWRALERSLPLVTDDKSAHFLFLPENEDPDSFVRTKGADAFNKLLKEQALVMTNFLLNQLTLEVNLNSDEGKARLVSLAKPYIEQTKAIALQVMLKKQLSRLVDLEPNVLESILNNRSRYAFYTSRWNKNQVTLPLKQNIATINIVEIITKHALNNIEWVLNYRLSEISENISNFTQEIQELAIVLDFIHNTYNKDDVIELNLIKTEIGLSAIDLEKIYKKVTNIILSEEEFRQTLDNLFGFKKRKVIKIPKIPMKN